MMLRLVVMDLMDRNHSVDDMWFNCFCEMLVESTELTNGGDAYACESQVG
jgi:hypothetical protein